MILIYKNNQKDVNSECLNNIVSILEREELNYKLINDSNLNDNVEADVLFVIGGDGTVLSVGEFANKNQIPILGFNVGQFGFLTEFDKSQIEEAVKMIKNNDYDIEKGVSAIVSTSNNKYFAINDAFIQRAMLSEQGSLVLEACVEIDGAILSKFKGDGVVVSTSIGATGYSLSAGGCVIDSSLNLFEITPICPRSLSSRSTICSGDCKIKVTLCGVSSADLFVDGVRKENLKNGACFVVEKAEKPTLFIKQKNHNFFNKYNEKFNWNGVICLKKAD